MQLEEIPVIYSDNHRIDPETDFHYSYISDIPQYPSYHKHDFYEIVLITRGNTYHLINTEKHMLHEGTMLFIRPDDCHYFAKVDDNICSFVNVAFSAEIFQTLVRYLGDKIDPEYFVEPRMPPVTMLTKEHTVMLHNRIDQINSYSHKAEMKAVFRAVMAEILICFLHEHFLLLPEKYPGWFYEFYNKLHRKEYFSRHIAHLYREMNRSREHIARVFKRIIGKTPTDFLNDIRLYHAARLLTHSDSSVLDVALESGFENLSHFYHLFRKKYGVTPCGMRDNYRNISSHSKTVRLFGRDADSYFW